MNCTTKYYMPMLFVLVLSGTSLGSPIYTDSSGKHYVDIAISVNSSVSLVPGEVGYVYAKMTNSGNRSARFSDYDNTNPIGGYGYDFNDPGMALGWGGVSFNGKASDFTFNFGLTDTLVPESSLSANSPDFSHLNNVTIDPGKTYEFVIYSMILSQTESIGSNYTFTNYLQAAFGKPIYEGVESENFTISILADNAYGVGAFQQLELTNFDFSANHPVPEPATAFLFGIGLAGLAGASFRKKNK